MGWRWADQTRCVLLDDEEKVLRTITVRPPFPDELPGPKFCVTGTGHPFAVHQTLEEAIHDAEASLYRGA